jgi:outer membrane lipoprotein-sorting protein
VAGKLAFAVPVLALLLLPAQSAFSAQTSANSGDLQRVLQQLDTSAKSFRTASADVKIEITQTEPVPNTDTQSGKVFYKHEGNQLQMALRITEQDGRPFQQILTYSKGVAQVYQGSTNQVTQHRNAAEIAPYLVMGFGASGREMADKFNITYLGQEKIDGVETDKLQLIAKDPKALRLFPKIILWIDPTRDISLKQFADQGQGMSRTATYSHLEINHSISSSEFTFKTNKSTQVTAQ